MIEAVNITKRFGSIEAVKGISFNIGKGEIVGFLGPNGAGKTTTMRILSCFMAPTSGTVKINGVCVTEDTIKIRRKIGYSLEKTSLYPDMRVLSFLNFVAEAKGVQAKHRKQHITEIIGLCGLENVQKRIIKNLSKGYQQRLTLAQALVNHPEILILDEPTVGLDPENVSEIRQLIKSLAGKRTIILSSHILPEVSMICGKVMIMDKGAIKAADTPKNLGLLLQNGEAMDLKIQGSQNLVAEALENIPHVRRVRIIEDISQDLFKYRVESDVDNDIFPALNAAAHKNNWILREMVPVNPTLEEIFLNAVGKKPANLG
jgi:ABC-2 type transport system ATP-binding protein